MTAERYNPKQKHIYFKAYEHLTLLEKALRYLKEQGHTGLQISIIGKVTQFSCDKNIEVSKDMDPLRLYWKDNLHNTTEFGSLNNPEIGNVFIVGTLTSIFLEKVDGKTLGMLSVGPHGILRGIGASEKQATNYLKLLKSGNYLLICRGCKEDLETYRELMGDKVNL